jgi:hypothetical protein
MNHHAAIELRPVRSVLDSLAGNSILEPQNVIRIRLIRVEVTKAHLEFLVSVVAHFDDAVLHAKGIGVVLVERAAGYLDGPARQILAVEQLMPLFRIRGGSGLDDEHAAHGKHCGQ